MKKMMTNMKTLVALLMAGATVTSCSSDNEMDSPKASAVKTYTMTVQATKGGDATTRALADGGDGTLTATWATTENVYVKKDDTWATGTLTPQTAGASTTLKGTLSGVTFAADDVLTLQFPKSGDITYAGQNGTLADIAANFDWATATIEVASVEGGNITPKAGASFAHQQAVVKFTLQDKGNSNAAISPSALTINDGTSDIVTLTSIPAETYTTNGEGVLYVALPAVSSKPITLTATVGSDTYTLTTSSAKSFANGSYYRVTAKMTKQTAVPTDALSGKFTINANGDQVYFSKGNLQATTANLGSTWTWAFAANQWDYIGNAAANTAVNGNGTVSANGTVDLFGWSTSATYLGIHTSSSSGDYSGDFADWGNNSELQSALGTGWFTLSSAEWTYLFNTRSNAASKFGYATVADKAGIIIVPDDFTDPMKNKGSGAFVGSTTTVWTANVYSAVNWSAMETAGCVFLPAAGSRNGTSVLVVGSYGYYWSGTARSTDRAYYVYFYSGDVTPADNIYRNFGSSVRLVHAVE